MGLQISGTKTKIKAQMPKTPLTEAYTLPHFSLFTSKGDKQAEHFWKFHFKMGVTQMPSHLKIPGNRLKIK